MNTEDNVVELTQEEYDSAMTELLAQVDQEQLGRTVAGVLEFLTVRAIIGGPFYLMSGDEQAITVIAANEDAANLRAALPDNFKSWDEYVEETVDYITDRDPEDEQDEPASEQE